jgi:hypothetical protein
MDLPTKIVLFYISSHSIAIDNLPFQQNSFTLIVLIVMQKNQLTMTKHMHFLVNCEIILQGIFSESNLKKILISGNLSEKIHLVRLY